ncbi:MAG: Do family serine endopeptidase [Bacteroidota bacterium]
MPVSRRLVQIGIGVGLLVVGLLTGVLVMLLVTPEPEAAVESPRPRIELGGNTVTLPPPTPTDSTAAPVSEPNLRTLNAAFRRIADRVTPTVVFIQIESDRNAERNFRFEGDMEQFMPPRMRQSVGSGVILSAEGHIVTNEHVVAQAEAIRVTLHNKRQYEARVVGTDPSTDLAVLKVDPEDPLPTAPLGDSDNLRVGDWVVAVGNPFRLTSTVTAGIVSALGRQVDIIDDTFSIEDFIQTDAAINPGNSGGALVNLNGELVGINTAIATESGSYEGYGFAVPTQLVQRVVTDLIEFGEVRRGYLGVSIEEVDAARADRLSMDRIQGVYVGTVRPGGAADEAGLQDGDVVLAIDGRPINAPNMLQSAVAQRRPGETMELRILRDGEEQTKQVSLMGREAMAYQEWLSELEGGADSTREPPQSGPADPPPNDEDEPDESDATVNLSEWGLGLRPLQDTHRTAFGIDQGAYVVFVENGERAARAGLRRDVVITHIEETPVESATEAERLLGEATPPRVLVRVQRRNGTGAFYEIERP